MQNQSPWPIRRAEFSPCATWRYSLERRWCLRGRRSASITFIGLNPSTADADSDDPTVRRCMGFARAWGYERLFMVNLFGYRTPFPSVLRAAPDPIGPDTDEALLRCVRRSSRVVVCWGEHGRLGGRDEAVQASVSRRLYCLGVNASGCPAHPLYLASDTPLRPYRVHTRLVANANVTCRTESIGCESV